MTVSLIIDTDCVTDCDDPGALAVACHAAGIGSVNILGVTVTDPAWQSASAVSACLKYYGQDAVPIGINKTAGAPAGSSTFTTDLATNFPTDIGSGTTITDATVLLRTLLHAAADNTVTIVCVGSLQNMANLLASASDGIDSRNGSDLIAAKVTATVIMGGQYPVSAAGSGGAGPEHNFNLHPASTSAVLSGWPVSIQFLGWETGNAVQVGTFLKLTPATNPVKAAYIDHNGGAPAASGSWDLTATDYACYGNVHSWYNSPTQGTNAFNSGTGENTFTAGAGTHYYLSLSASALTVALGLNQQIMAAPGAPSPQSSFSLQFTGSQYGTRASVSPLEFGSGTNFTLSCWFKSTTTSGNAIILRKGINGGANGYGIDIQDNKIRGLVRGDSGIILPVSSANVADGAWHHVAMTVTRGGNTLMYLDGTQVASDTTPTGSLTVSDALTFGNRADGDAPVGGKIDDVAVFNSVLSSGTIAGIAAGSTNVADLSPVALWRIEDGAGAGILDTSGNGNDVTLNGSPTWSTDVPTPLAPLTGVNRRRRVLICGGR